MNTAVHFSSASDDWATPQDLFDKLNAEFQFTLDVCASPENAKCSHYYTKKENGLVKDWSGHSVWCNPPYGRAIVDWVRRCSQTVWCPHATGSLHCGCMNFAASVAVMLLPARTDTRWWHDFVIPYADDIRFLRGRLKFGGHKNSAPFPSAVVVFRSTESK